MGSETGYDWKLQDNDTLTTSGGENDHRDTVNTTNLYRAFLDYRFRKEITDTHIRIGRQGIVSPLLMNSGVYPMKDSFDAAVLENKDIQNTLLRVMYVTKWNMRYGDDNNGHCYHRHSAYSISLHT